MGIWFKRPELQDAEEVKWSGAANHTRGRTAVGGRLDLTTERIIFTPNRFESLLGRRAWTRPLSEIVDVALQGPRPSQAIGGGLRTRVEVAWNDGSAELFVVGRPDECVARIQSLLG